MTKAQKKEIIRRIKAGESRTSISADLGFDKGYLRKIWNDYKLLGQASLAATKFGPPNKNIPKRKPPTPAQKKKIRTLLETARQPMTVPAIKDLIKNELGLTITRKYLIQLINEWNLDLAPGPQAVGPGTLAGTEIAKLSKQENKLRAKLNRRLASGDLAEWQILGLPRGNRRDGPGPQWRKRQYEQNKHSYFYLELWTAGPETLLTPQSRQLLKKKIFFYSKHLGVDILSFVIMDSHCFLLVHLPPREAWIDKLRDPQKFLQRARELFQPSVYERIKKQFATVKDPKKLLDYYLAEFCELSVFVKRLKESVSRAHNLHQNTTGALWMERYRSLELTTRQERIDCHLRINRWPITRGLVEPNDLPSYPWSSFGELQTSGKRAIKGTCRALGIPLASWKKHYPADPKKGRKRSAQKWFFSEIQAPVDSR